MFKNFKITNFISKKKSIKEIFEDFFVLSIAIIMFNLGFLLLENIFYGGLVRFFKEIPEALFYSLLQILAFFLLIYTGIFIWWLQKKIFYSTIYNTFFEKNFIFKTGFVFTLIHFLFLIIQKTYLIKYYYETIIILIPILFFSWLKDKKYTVKYFLFFIIVSSTFLILMNYFKNFYIFNYFLKKDYTFKVYSFFIYHLMYFLGLQIIYNFFKKISYKN